MHYNKKMISIKKENDIFTYSKYDLILENNEQIYAYTRTWGEDKVVVICNLSPLETVYSYKDIKLIYDGLILCNYNVQSHNDTTSFVLKAYETRVYKKKSV